MGVYTKILISDFFIFFEGRSPRNKLRTKMGGQLHGREVDLFLFAENKLNHSSMHHWKLLFESD